MYILLKQQSEAGQAAEVQINHQSVGVRRFGSMGETEPECIVLFQGWQRNWSLLQAVM